MKKILMTLALTSSLAISQLSAAENNFIMDIMPGSAIMHSDIDGFSNNYGGSSYYASETIKGKASFSPNIALGYGLDLPYFSLDTTVGGGAMINGAFTATYLQGEVTAYVTSLKKGFMIGPFFRYVDISDPKWVTDNLKMVGTTANAYGIAMMTGGKKVKFKMKVSQLTGANIAVTGRNGYIPSKNTLSLDGVSIELGLALRF